MRDSALILHVVAGLVGVVFGPLAVVVTLRARRLTWAGEIFHWAVAIVCLTALVMVPYDWGRLWVFWPISLASYLFVYLGQCAAESPGDLWTGVCSAATAAAGSPCGQRSWWSTSPTTLGPGPSRSSWA